MRCNAFSLVEVSLGLVLIALLISLFVSGGTSMAEYARGKKTLRDMAVLLDVGRQYKAVYGQWPENMSTLQLFAPQVQSQNSWGFDYVLRPKQQCLEIETTMPDNRAAVFTDGMMIVSSPSGYPGHEKIRMSGVARSEKIARLMYERK